MVIVGNIYMKGGGIIIGGKGGEGVCVKVVFKNVVDVLHTSIGNEFKFSIKRGPGLWDWIAKG